MKFKLMKELQKMVDMERERQRQVYGESKQRNAKFLVKRTKAHIENIRKKMSQET